MMKYDTPSDEVISQDQAPQGGVQSQGTEEICD
jgi:hypothetical protein